MGGESHRLAAGFVFSASKFYLLTHSIYGRYTFSSASGGKAVLQNMVGAFVDRPIFSDRYSVLSVDEDQLEQMGEDRGYSRLRGCPHCRLHWQ